jgi:hypothetical protein
LGCSRGCADAAGGVGDGEAPEVPEFRYLGSMLSRNFHDSVTIMPVARIRLARIAFTKLQKATFGTRRVALESKKIAYESPVLSLLSYGSECWVVRAENMRLLQRFQGKCIRIMCRVTRHHTRKHHISAATEELEAKLGIHDIRHYVHSRALRYLGHVFRVDADRTPSPLQRCCARCSGSRGIRVSSPSCRQTALCCHQRGCIIHITSSWRLGSGVGNMQT